MDRAYIEPPHAVVARVLPPSRPVLLRRDVAPAVVLLERAGVLDAAEFGVEYRPRAPGVPVRAPPRDVHSGRVGYLPVLLGLGQAEELRRIRRGLVVRHPLGALSEHPPDAWQTITAGPSPSPRFSPESTTQWLHGWSPTRSLTRVAMC